MNEDIKVAFIFSVFVIAFVAIAGAYFHWDWERHIEKTETQEAKELGRRYQREFKRVTIRCCVSMAVVVTLLFFGAEIIRTVVNLCG